MPTFDLKTEDGFRKACQHFVANPPVTATAWRTELTNFLQWVQKANLATRSSLEFQERLWDFAALQNQASSALQNPATCEA